MLLSELLDSVGLNQGEFAKLMEVNRKTVSRWVSKEQEADEDMIAVIDEYKASMTHEQSESVPIPAASDNQVIESSNDQSEVWAITHENIALSRIKYGREDWPIKDVAALFGLSIFAYNAEVQNTINHCVETGTSFAELRQ